MMINGIESVAAGSNNRWSTIGVAVAAVGVATLGVATFYLRFPDWANEVGVMGCYAILLFGVLRGHFEDHHCVKQYHEYLRSLDVAVLKKASALAAISERSRAEVTRFLNTYHVDWSAQ
jgi:hypothetical protein